MSLCHKEEKTFFPRFSMAKLSRARKVRKRQKQLQMRKIHKGVTGKVSLLISCCSLCNRTAISFNPLDWVSRQWNKQWYFCYDLWQNILLKQKRTWQEQPSLKPFNFAAFSSCPLSFLARVHVSCSLPVILTVSPNYKTQQSSSRYKAKKFLIMLVVNAGISLNSTFQETIRFSITELIFTI